MSIQLHLQMFTAGHHQSDRMLGLFLTGTKCEVHIDTYSNMMDSRYEFEYRMKGLIVALEPDVVVTMTADAREYMVRSKIDVPQGEIVEPHGLPPNF